MVGLLFVVVLFAVAGCATNQSMSAAQIEAATKDKSVTVVCAKVLGPWGTAETTIVTYDQRVISNGGVTVGEKCSTAVTDSKTAPDRSPPVVVTPLPAR